MHYPTAQDHRLFTDCQAEFVERIELERKARFDLHPAAAHLADRCRLKDLDLALEQPQQIDAPGIPLVFVSHGY